MLLFCSDSLLVLSFETSQLISALAKDADFPGHTYWLPPWPARAHPLSPSGVLLFLLSSH